MKTIKMLVVSGVIATMSAYAQDGSKQQAKKQESIREVKLKQEITIKQKSNQAKSETSAPASKESKPAAEPKKHEEKKANSPN
jgi:hypothetical protein